MKYFIQHIAVILTLSVAMDPMLAQALQTPADYGIQTLHGMDFCLQREAMANRPSAEPAVIGRSIEYRLPVLIAASGTLSPHYSKGRGLARRGLLLTIALLVAGSFSADILKHR